MRHLRPEATSEEISDLYHAIGVYDFSLKMEVLRHPNTSPLLLTHLGKSKDATVRIRVAEHPSTPRGTLIKLAQDHHPGVSNAALKRVDVVDLFDD